MDFHVNDYRSRILGNPISSISRCIIVSLNTTQKNGSATGISLRQSRFLFSAYLRQYRTKSVWRLCTPSACKFPVIFHKNAREYIQYSLRFLFHLTKNLTTHLSHNLCVVLPCVSIITICGKNICQNLLHHFRTMCLNLRRQGGQSGEGAFPVSLAKKSERVPVFGEHALIPRQHRTKPA